MGQGVMDPILRRDQASADFFDAAADGRLLLKRCQVCHSWSEPRALVCRTCRSTAVAWAEADKLGRVVSTAAIPAADEDDVMVAIVETDEGPWLRGVLEGVQEASAGQRVEIAFHERFGEFVPFFRAADAPELATDRGGS